ncbi:hypothetical protein KR032_008060 [Drosophila birchii]|nr:hypothetical protein KR032_008060 [Drosophila birchii]
MGNAESRQDHYKVLGVNPDATETRITKAFRSEALKWHPYRRTPGDIDTAYRVLSNPIKRASYNASRGSGRKGNGKGIFFYIGIVVTGYITYKLWRSGKLEEIGQAAMEKIGILINWVIEFKDSDSASTLKMQLASSGQAAMEKVDTIVNWASEVKDSDAASALGSKLASSAQAAMEKVDTIVNWASEVKDSDAASALGSKLASSASSLASASNDGLAKVAKWFQN